MGRYERVSAGGEKVDALPPALYRPGSWPFHHEE